MQQEILEKVEKIENGKGGDTCGSSESNLLCMRGASPPLPLQGEVLRYEDPAMLRGAVVNLFYCDFKPMVGELATLIADKLTPSLVTGPTVRQEAPSFTKPILTMQEAADLLGISTKRLNNIIYDEKARLGSLPDWVCDAGGILQKRIITAPLLEWTTQRKKRRVRK